MEDKIDFEDLAKKINRLILLLQIVYSKKVVRKFRSDLTQSQIVLLQYVRVMGNPNISSISNAMNSKTSFVSKITSSLEEKGFVKRINKPKLGREIFLELTDRGNEVIDEIENFDKRSREDILKLASQDLGSEKVKAIEDVVDYIIDRTEEEVKYL